MLFGSFARVEGAEVPLLARFWILLARVETILARLKFSDQRTAVLTFDYVHFKHVSIDVWKWCVRTLQRGAAL